MTSTFPRLPAATTTPALRIVLAEDDREMRCLLEAALRFDGALVEPLAHGGALLARLDSPPLPDLVVTDIRMPGASGVEILRRARARGLEVPFVVLTGFGTPDLHAEVAALRRATLLDKPFDLDDLRTAVANAARLR